jgi:hypothetical protein
MRDLRQTLRNDPRFNDSAHDFTGRRRGEYLEEFWTGIYHGPLNQGHDEYLNMMGQRLAWYGQALDNLNQLEPPARSRE